MATSRFLPRGSLVWLAFAACSASLLWLGFCAKNWEGEPRTGWHYYERLTEGFLQGHTYMNLDPGPQMKALKDPYDSIANAAFRYRDASYFHERYYLYFGPTPVVLLMAPVKALTGYMIPQRMVAAWFAIAALAALALLLVELRNQRYPQVGDGFLALTFVFLAHASWLPVIMAQPSVWELAILSDVAMLTWAFYFLWRFHAGARKTGWALAVAASGVFAMGSRPTSLFPVGVLVGALAWSEQGWLATAAVRRTWLLSVGWVVAGGLGLLAYNQARFGTPFEFGQHYQLWGTDERGISHFSARYIGYNLHTYLFSFPSFTAYFPFIVNSVPSAKPSGYIGGDEVFGVVLALPVLLFSASAIHRLWQGRLRAEGPGLAPAVATALAAAVCTCGLLCLFAGACCRYVTEWVACWTVLAAVGSLGVAASPGRWLRRLLLLAGVWTVVITWLSSFSFENQARWSAPATYETLSHWFDWPAYEYAKREHLHFGPIQARIHLERTSSGADILVRNGVGNAQNQLLLRWVDSTHVRIELVQTQGPEALIRVMSDPIAVGAGTIDLWFEAPWLYPPAGDPYWNSSSAPEALARQTRFTLVANGRGVRLFSKDYNRIVLKTEIMTGPTPDSQTAWVASYQQ